jgi:hypothetical protein
MLDTAYLKSFSIAPRAHHNFERFDPGLSVWEVDVVAADCSRVYRSVLIAVMSDNKCSGADQA